MSRLTKLHKNPQHEQAENTDFILRLRFKKENDLPLKIDCINLSIQYMALYKAIELRLEQLITANTLYLDIFNKDPWAGRSEHLKNDIREMRAGLSDVERPCVLEEDDLFPAVQEMIDQIAETDPVTLFAYLSVRCLGDAFGGQALNTYTQRTFENQILKGAFYGSVEKQASTLSTFVNNTPLNIEEETQFYKAVDKVFKLHIDLFNQMEEERVIPEKAVEKKSDYYSNGFRFGLFAFSAVALTAVAASTVASLSIGSSQQ